MTGGLVQLVAFGAQDVYLTGSPQITFFKVVYRRHTNYANEHIDLTFSGGNVDFGRNATCQITRNGDLVGGMWLKATIGLSDADVEVANPDVSHGWALVERPGHALIDEVEVTIGGTKIDRQYGDWLNVWYELARDTQHDRGYDEMSGNIKSVVCLAETHADVTIQQELAFWFNRNYGLCLPLIALQYHDVKLEFKFRPLSELLVTQNCSVSGISITTGELMVEYIYLDAEERKRFAQASHEYLVEQVQHTGKESVDTVSPTLRLTFNHPTKFLTFALKLNKWTSGDTHVLGYNPKDWQAALDHAARVAWLFTRAVPGSAGSAETTIDTDPDGDLTGDVAEWFDASAPRVLCHVQDHNAATVADVLENIDTYVVVDHNSLTIADISVDYTDTELFPTTYLGRSGETVTVADYLVNVRQWHNYGINLDGSGNPLTSAEIQLNGHERFREQEADFFNYVLPRRHFAVTPADGLNVYSFAIKPLEHQPSGSLNLSRIENTQIKPHFVAGTEGDIYIYGLSYNILRIMSGMGGLKIKRSEKYPASNIWTLLGDKSVEVPTCMHSTRNPDTSQLITGNTTKLFGEALKTKVLKLCEKSITGTESEPWYSNNLWYDTTYNMLLKWVIRIQASKAVMIRPRRRFNDYMVVGPRELIILNEGLRYSLVPVKYTERWGTNEHIPTKHCNNYTPLLYCLFRHYTPCCKHLVISDSTNNIHQFYSAMISASSSITLFIVKSTL